MVYEWGGETMEDLPLYVGDVITVTQEINDEWLRGTNQMGQQGIFPSQFIEPL